MTGDRRGRLTPSSHLKNIVMANHGGSDRERSKILLATAIVPLSIGTLVMT
jgi:hypothetical protein